LREAESIPCNGSPSGGISAFTVDRFRILLEQSDGLVAGDDFGAVILTHIVERSIHALRDGGGHRIPNDENVVVQIKCIYNRMLDAGLGPERP
jgi:hypothetical protein